MYAHGVRYSDIFSPKESKEMALLKTSCTGICINVKYCEWVLTGNDNSEEGNLYT